MSNILVQSRTLSQKMKLFFMPTTLAILLAACSSTPDLSPLLRDDAYANSEFYINKIDQSTRLEDKQTYRLLAVRKLIEENKSVEAQQTFSGIDTLKLDEIQKVEYQLLTAQLYALHGNEIQANLALKRLPVGLSTSQYLRVYQTEARLAENRQDVLGSVRARALMDRYLRDNRSRQENNDIIWEQLRHTNRGMLAGAQAAVGEGEFAGWLALINQYNAHINNPTQLPQVLENWKQLYPNHGANKIQPTELQNIANFQQTQLNGVALFLPLSGDAQVLGDIIKRGFNDAKGTDSLPVKIYDTDSADIETLLEQAHTDGAQTLIGPLLKTRVDQVLQSQQRGQLNILALNSTPNAQAIPRVCYYGLSPEAEAHAAAEQFKRDGVLNAVVAAPQTDFGYRSANAFAQRWRELTHNDADIRYFNQAQDSVATLQNLGMNSQSALYVIGSAEELFEIKQGIDFAGFEQKFPIYASSRSHSPNSGDEFLLTMEGVKFSEIPLFADLNSAEFKQAAKLSQGDYSMMRLYAMGSDAWSIANKFNEFRQIPGFKISGLTGVLSAGVGCNIERQMTWFQYRNGAIVAIN